MSLVSLTPTTLFYFIIIIVILLFLKKLLDKHRRYLLGEAHPNPNPNPNPNYLTNTDDTFGERLTRKLSHTMSNLVDGNKDKMLDLLQVSIVYLNPYPPAFCQLEKAR